MILLDVATWLPPWEYAEGVLAGLATIITAIGSLLVKVMLDQRRIKEKQAQTHAQLKPNGGGSLRDAVDRIESTLERVADRQNRAERRTDRELTNIRRRLNQLEGNHHVDEY